MAANAPDTIGPETQVNGTLTGTDPLLVEGQVEGNIELENVLTVAPSGRVKANVTAREVVLEGRFEGKINARERVVLRKDSFADGDITTPRIVVEDGSTFNGNLYMNNSAG
jgi:cytoskeletal protein CcmA (bactofilin family)